MRKSLRMLAAFTCAALLMGCSNQTATTTTTVAAGTETKTTAEAAQDNSGGYPARQIDMIVPYSAGGDTDMVARAVADYLSKEWGQPIVVVNQSGGIATSKEVSKAEPDGHTVVVVPSGEASVHHANNTKVTVDFTKDLTAVARLTRFPIAFCVNAEAEWDNFKEFSDWVVKNPDQLTWGSSSMTGPAAITVADWCKAIGADFTKTRMVQASGASDGATKVAGGHIVTHIGAPKGFMPLVEAGKCKLIAVSPFRHTYYSDIPTAEEQGVEGLSYSNAVCLWMPSGVDQSIIDKWNEGLEKAFSDEEFLAGLEKIEAMGDYLNSEDTTAFIKDEIDNYTALAEELGLRK